MDVAVPSRYPHRIKYLLIVYIVIVRVTIPKLMGHASRWIFPWLVGVEHEGFVVAEKTPKPRSGYGFGLIRIPLNQYYI